MLRQWPGIRKRAKHEPEGRLVSNILQTLCLSSSLDSCPDFSQRWIVTQKWKPNKQFPPQVNFCDVLSQQQKAKQSTCPEVCLLGDSISWNLIIYINNHSGLSSTHPGWPGRPESHVYPQSVRKWLQFFHAYIAAFCDLLVFVGKRCVMKQTNKNKKMCY